MTSTAILSAVLLLAGCATDGLMRIRWTEHDYVELQRICATPKTFKGAGCYRKLGDACVVYTLRGDPAMHDTLGHEVRHCFQGRFH